MTRKQWWELDPDWGAFINEIPDSLLSRAQEMVLFKRIEAGRAAASALADAPLEEREALTRSVSAGQAAWEEVVNKNIRLAIFIAAKHFKGDVELYDLIQEGCVGLIKAVEKFEVERGYKFSTYAYNWIRQAVTRANADQGRTIRLPVHVGDQATAIWKAIEKVKVESGDKPDNEQIGEMVGQSAKKVKFIISSMRSVASLDEEINGNGKLRGHYIPDESGGQDPESEAGQALKATAIDEALATLSCREERILRLRFWGGLTLEEVGEKFKLTRERIRQIEKEALRKLRQSFRSDPLRGLV